jgi:cell division protein FtsQ
MSPVAAPADRRFRRAHVKPGRRRRVWQTLAVPALKHTALACIFLYGAYRMTGLAAQAQVLRIERISVHGNGRLSRTDVLSSLRGLNGQSLVWADLDFWRQQLLKSPWVRDAAMRRSLPSTVDVVISERKPVGVGRIKDEMYLIDERGAIIDRFGPQYADLDLPIVDGLALLGSTSLGSTSAGSTSAGSSLMTDEPRAELAARVITALQSKPQIASRLSQVDVRDVHNAAVILNGDSAVIQLGEDQFLARLESYLDLASALHERVAEIDYVYLRFDDRIYVRPAGKRR